MPDREEQFWDLRCHRAEDVDHGLLSSDVLQSYLGGYKRFVRICRLRATLGMEEMLLRNADEHLRDNLASQTRTP
jgi:hypothetical protein